MSGFTSITGNMVYPTSFPQSFWLNVTMAKTLADALRARDERLRNAASKGKPKSSMKSGRARAGKQGQKGSRTGSGSGSDIVDASKQKLLSIYGGSSSSSTKQKPTPKRKAVKKTIMKRPSCDRVGTSQKKETEATGKQTGGHDPPPPRTLPSLT